MRIMDWVAAKDPDYLALRRAVRAAIVAPICLALTVEVIGDAAMATFSVFAAIGLLILVDIPGPMRQRLVNYAALAGAGAVLVCLATPLSGNVWLATISMAVVGFAIVFVGVLSSVLAASTTTLLLAWILPVSTQGSAADIPARVVRLGPGIGAGDPRARADMAAEGSRPVARPGRRNVPANRHPAPRAGDSSSGSFERRGAGRRSRVSGRRRRGDEQTQGDLPPDTVPAYDTLHGWSSDGSDGRRTRLGLDRRQPVRVGRQAGARGRRCGRSVGRGR